MTPEHQQIAIAEFCGWIEIELVQGKPYGIEDSRLNKHPMPLPNYPLNLNAMHEAEKLLTPEQEVIYVERLGALIMNDAYESEARYMKSHLSSGDSTYRATASQRSEAFCRTIGKWVEE